MRLLTLRLTLVCLCMLAGILPLPAMAQNTATTAAKPPLPTGNWAQLKPAEQRALAPLAAKWGELTDRQRSKWLAIAQQFDKLSPAEQQVMQARMAEWVALSPVQRNQARLNFNTVQGLSRDEKKTRWDEYQALSEEEKRKLSAGSLAPAKTAAPSPRPVSQDRLVQPTVRSLPPAALPPRTPVDHKTLLPVPAAPAAPHTSHEAPAPAADPSSPSREASGS